MFVSHVKDNSNSRFIQHLFPVPICGTKLSGAELSIIQNEMSSVVSKIKWDTPDGWGNSHLLSTLDFKSNDIELYSMVEFYKILDRELKSYCDYIEYEFKSYKVTSWFSKFRSGDFGHIHTHGNADISGVYYFQTDGDDGDLTFMSVNSAAMASKAYSKHNQYHDQQPEIGKLLMFPGWLPHGIKRNNSSHDRISFAFNIYFE